MWVRLYKKLQYLFRRDRFDRELAEEMDFHREMLEWDKTREGLAREVAAVTARRQLGNTTLTCEYSREVWIIAWFETLIADLRYAFRTTAAHTTFSALAILTIALGIGANTAIYSFLDSILLRSLPVPDPESLVVLNWHAKAPGRLDFVMHGMSGSTWDDSALGRTSGIFPYPAFELFRKCDSVLSTVFAHYQSSQMRNLNLSVNGHADVASGWSVSGGYFRGLAVPAAAGRLILPDDDRPGAPPVAVVSFGLSQRHFGKPGNAVGQPILINNLPFTVVGVAPPGFFGVDPTAVPDVYLPMHTNELLGAGNQFGFRPERYFDRNYYWVQLMGRLRPGVSLAQAQATLAPPFQQWVAGTATNDRERANLPALVVEEGAGGLDTLRRRYSQPLYVLMTLVGLILSLACANVASLLLTRAAARGREIALRLSLGAGRLRIVRQLLTESILLALLGGSLGVLLAIWGMRFLTLLLANGRANFTLHAELNWHVLGVAAALSIVTGVLFGLAPAMRSTRPDLLPALKTTRMVRPRAAHRFARAGWGHLLLVSQIAISLLMLVAAGLFGRTLLNLKSVELGFNGEDVLLFQLDARKAGRKDPEIAAFYGELRRRFGTIPGVRNVSLSEDSLIEAGTGLPIGLYGAPPDSNNSILAVGPSFFDTMQIPVLAGRDFEESDRAGSPAVAIINETFAKANFGDRNPLGQRLILRKAGKDQPTARDMQIVGVARNSRYGSLTGRIPPVIYMPYDQGYPNPDQMVYALRTTGDPLRYVNAVREIVRQADPRLPVSEIRTQSADIDRTINQEITFAKLCSSFAGLALLIACIGLYGTVSYNVARRTSEIGIRIALGAQRGEVRRMVLREVLALAAAGIAIGTVVALGTSKFVASFLYGIKANDPVAFVLALLSMFMAILSAGYAPAWKASRIDPMHALRHE